MVIYMHSFKDKTPPASHLYFCQPTLTEVNLPAVKPPMMCWSTQNKTWRLQSRLRNLKGSSEVTPQTFQYPKNLQFLNNPGLLQHSPPAHSKGGSSYLLRNQQVFFTHLSRYVGKTILPHLLLSQIEYGLRRSPETNSYLKSHVKEYWGNNKQKTALF